MSISNHPPNVTSANLSSATPSADADLTISYACSDEDSPHTCDSSVNYTWWKNSTNLLINSSTLTSGNYTEGDNLTASVRVYDGYNWSDWLNTSVATVNYKPVMNASSITPAITYTNNTLIGWCNATDADGGNTTYEYRWYVDGNLSTNGTTTNTTQGVLYNIGNVSNASTSAAENWTLSCRATDDVDYSSWINSSAQYVRLLPSVTAAEIIPSSGFTDASNISINFTCTDYTAGVNCSANAWFKWFVNDVELNVTTQNLTTGNYSDGDNITASVMVGDGTLNTTWTNTSEVYVGDVVDPVLVSYSVAPTSMYLGESVLFKATCTDDVAGIRHARFYLTTPAAGSLTLTSDTTNGTLYSVNSVLALTGFYTVDRVECVDNSGNTDDAATSLTLSVLPAPSGGGGGGGGGETTIIDYTNDLVVLDPTSATHSVAPGATRTYEFTIENPNSNAVTVTATVLQEGEAASWVSFADGTTSTTIEVSGGQQLESNKRYVRYTIVVPSDAEIGEYSATIIVEQEGKGSQSFLVKVLVQDSFFASVQEVLTRDVYNTGDGWCLNPFSSEEGGECKAVLAGIGVNWFVVIIAAAVLLFAAFIIVPELRGKKWSA